MTSNAIRMLKRDLHDASYYECLDILEWQDAEINVWEVAIPSHNVDLHLTSLKRKRDIINQHIDKTYQCHLEY